MSDYRTCIFSTPTRCSALKEYYCRKKQVCNYYKNNAEWELDSDKFPVRKESNNEKKIHD